MIQGNLFGGGGGGEKKARRAAWDKTRFSQRKLRGLCFNCPSQALPGNTRCERCAEARRRYAEDCKTRLIAAGICSKCRAHPIADSSSWECRQCLAKQNRRNQLNRQGVYGRWAHLIRIYTRRVAGGICKNFSIRLGWDHADFCVRFVDYRRGDKRVIDHQIPKKCARLPDGGLDQAFACIVAGLENLQLLTQSANIHKGRSLDRQILARSNALRLEGLAGAELFHRLWEEFSEAAQAYGDHPGI